MEKKMFVRIVFVLLSMGIWSSTFGIAHVKAQPDPDLNDDGVVDIKDLSIAAQAYGSYPGHPKWNSDADLNEDGKVDIRDLALIAKDFGKT